jgi:serine protease Do
MVAETPIGQDVEVVVWRKGETKTVTIHLGELDDEQIALATPAPEVVEDTGKVPDLGLALGKITPELRERFGLAEKTDGVVITEVDTEGSAAEKGLKPGDVIVEVDQEEVDSPAQVAERVKKAKDEGYRVVTLLVFRQGDFQWVAVRIDKS